MALAQTLAEKERDIIVVDIDRQLVQAAALFTENALIVSDFSQESLRQVEYKTATLCWYVLMRKSTRASLQL